MKRYCRLGSIALNVSDDQGFLENMIQPGPVHEKNRYLFSRTLLSGSAGELEILDETLVEAVNNLVEGGWTVDTWYSATEVLLVREV